MPIAFKEWAVTVRALAEGEQLSPDFISSLRRQHRTAGDVMAKPVVAVAEDTACRHIRVNPAFARLLRLPAGANASLSAPPEERPAYKIYHDGRELTAEQFRQAMVDEQRLIYEFEPVRTYGGHA